MFSAYFRYELPEAVFSSVELEGFLNEFARVDGPDKRIACFGRKLQSLEKGSLRRDDFLRKLSTVVPKLDRDVAVEVARAVVAFAHEYTYDLMAGFAEGGRALRIVIKAAERLPLSQRAQLLSSYVTSTTDDTMAATMLNVLTDPQGDAGLGVGFQELYPAFIQRMRKRYGREADVSKVDLTTSDSRAFMQWGAEKLREGTADPLDRQIQREFWLRHIGSSRATLADDFQNFLMPIGYLYTEDPTPVIECKLPVEDLRRLFNEIPADDTLTKPQRKSLRRLKRFLDGEFANGMRIAELDEPGDGD